MNLIITEILTKKETKEIRFAAKNEKDEIIVQGAILINRPSFFLSSADAGESLNIEMPQQCQMKK